MGCGSSNAQTALETNYASMPHKNGDVTKSDKADDKGNVEQTTVPAIEIPPSEAFEIPFDDNGTNGLIKKHPPKRLQRLEEQSNSLAPPTIEDLEEKLATAELRRKEYLSQKVTTAKQMQKTGNDDDEENANTTDEPTNDEN